MSDRFIPGLRHRTRAQELWLLVIESFRLWEDRIHESASAVGLSPVSAWALVQLDPDAPISQKELASRLHCKPSTVVDPTDRLEAAGLVARQANPADRRVKVLVVTPNGKQVRDDLMDRLLEPPPAFKRVSGKDLIRFRDVMMAAVIGRAGSEPRYVRSEETKERI